MVAVVLLRYCSPNIFNKYESRITAIIPISNPEIVLSVFNVLLKFVLLVTNKSIYTVSNTSYFAPVVKSFPNIAIITNIHITPLYILSELAFIFFLAMAGF